jgi:hypothetical protein
MPTSCDERLAKKRRNLMRHDPRVADAWLRSTQESGVISLRQPEGKALMVLDSETAICRGPRIRHWDTATDQLFADFPGPYSRDRSFVVADRQTMASHWTNAAYL